MGIYTPARRRQKTIWSLNRFTGADPLLLSERSGRVEDVRRLIIRKVKPSQGPQLVGRERERRILIEALTAATDSRSTLVDVSGPQGIGKTSLLQWFEVEATQLGYTCLTASGFRQESNHPNGALTRLLSATLTDASLHDLIEPYDAASLKSALPGIRDPANGADEPVTQIESLRALHAILTVIGEIGSGLVIIVDNIEFVDEMTLAALSYVCRRGIGAPLLIVAATRVDALRHELAPSVSTRIALVLAPLDRSELARLVVDIPAPVQEQLLDVADGNAFYAIELAAHHRRGLTSVPPTDRVELPALPISVADAILDEVSTLPKPAHALIRAAAVLGDGFSRRVAFKLSEIDEGEGFVALDQLVERSLIRELPHASFRFRHPLVASVIYESIAPGTRIDLHQRAARLIESSGGDPVSAARHIIASAEIGDAEAIEKITLAALSCRGVAPRTVVELTSAALALIPERGSLTAKRPFLQTIEADGFIRTGRFPEAERTVKYALANLDPDDTIALAWLTVTLLRVQRWMGHNDSAIPTLSRALDALPEDKSFERAMLTGTLAMEYARVNETAEMRHHYAAAIVYTEKCAQPFMTLAVHIVVTMSEALAGDAHKASDAAVAAEKLLENLSAEQVRLGVDAIAILASVQDWLGRSEEALRCASQGRRAAIESGNRMAEFWFTLAAAIALTSLGRLESARETVESAEQLARVCLNNGLISVSLGLAADISVKLGDLASARTQVEDCLTYRSVVTDRNMQLMALGLALPALVSLGRNDEAIVEFVDDSASKGMTEIPKTQRASLYEWLVTAELARGDVEAARRWSHLAAASADDVDMDLSTAAASRAAAAVSAACGEWSGALSCASHAVSAAERTGRPYELAESLLLEGRILISAGQRESAVTKLESAMKTFNDCGARGMVSQVRQRLRELGVNHTGPRPKRGAFGIDSLSGREREVADLVAAGLTNPQIAEQLFLSVRTVESHLRRIFVKLDADSRGEVASAVHRSQIVAD